MSFGAAAKGASRGAPELDTEVPWRAKNGGRRAIDTLALQCLRGMVNFFAMNPTKSRPDFTGLWEVNFSKSTMRGPHPTQILIKIEHREPQLVQRIFVSYERGKEESLTFTYTTDGQESFNSIHGQLCPTRARWEARDLVIESSMKGADRELHFEDHWSLSSDGNTLTMAHRNDDLAGQVAVLERVPSQAARKFADQWMR